MENKTLVEFAKDYIQDTNDAFQQVINRGAIQILDIMERQGFPIELSNSELNLVNEIYHKYVESVTKENKE